MFILVRTPAGNERGPQYMHQVLDALHHAIGRRSSLRLCIGRLGEHWGVGFHAVPGLTSLAKGQLQSQYPACELGEISEPDAGEFRSIPLWLSGDLLPLKTYPRFVDALNRVTADPLALILTSLSAESGATVPARLYLSVRSATKREIRRARRVYAELSMMPWHHWRDFQATHLIARRSAYPIVRWMASAIGYVVWLVYGKNEPLPMSEHSLDLDAVQRKLGEHVFSVSAAVSVPAATDRRTEAQVTRAVVAALNAFAEPDCPKFVSRLARPHARFLLSSAEIATLWHPPTATVETPARPLVLSRELEPPVDIPTPDREPTLAVLGEAAFRGAAQPCGLLPDDRRRHLALLGKTGMGKTTLMQNLILDDIHAGRGVAVIDPHGDLAEAIAAHIPRRRTNDVILLDAADAHYPVSFNPLDCPVPHLRPLVASGVLSAFRKLYADSWGPRLEHILRNTLFTLLEIPGSSLADVPRLLTDSRYRHQATARIADPVVRAFWDVEFEPMPAKLRAEATSPVLNKVGQFLTNPVLRNILAQSQSRLDLRAVMDRRRILVASVSKGRLGEDASALLGSFLITALQVATMSRADAPEKDRTDFYLYVDEFGSFATDAFASILSEARKYRLNLIVANQYLAQLSESTLAALFGNVGSILAFQLGAQDAPVIAEQLGPPAGAEDLMMLPRHHAYARILINGQPTRPFSLRTIPPDRPRSDTQHPDVLRRTSHRRYARPVSSVRRDFVESRN